MAAGRTSAKRSPAKAHRQSVMLFDGCQQQNNCQVDPNSAQDDAMFFTGLAGLRQAETRLPESRDFQALWPSQWHPQAALPRKLNIFDLLHDTV